MIDPREKWFHPEDRFVLGSRSPRRRELLELIVPQAAIVVCPPLSTEELGFDSVIDEGINGRLLEIAEAKRRDVEAQVLEPGGPNHRKILIVADTVIVVQTGQGLKVLGQPPEQDWQRTVTQWFFDHIEGRPHQARTALSVSRAGDSKRVQKIVTTEILFQNHLERWLPFFLDSQESRGKAGGYGLQGLGSIFIEKVQGSLSNVIGLPLRELLEAFQELEILRSPVNL